MNKERLEEIKDSVNFQREILKAHNMETLCIDEEQELIEEIERLNNKVEELMTLYTTEREVKEDYKSIIKEVREYIEKHIAMFKNGNMLVDINVDELLEILDKENKQ